MDRIKSSKLFKTSNLLVFALIIGLGVGIYVTYALTTPRIEELNEALNQKTSQIASINIQLAAIHANYTEALSNLTQVTQQYNYLVSNSVTRAEFEELEDDYEDLLKTHQEQSDELAELQSENEILAAENEALITEYQLLLAKYDELKLLPWTAFTVNNLRVNLTVASNTYASNLMPVTGKITIKYLDGKPFNGKIQLQVWSDYYKNGKMSPIINISGSTPYSIEAAFNLPGRYYLLLASIKDTSDNVIASYNDLLLYRISLVMG